jgi:hypothetical protein
VTGPAALRERLPLASRLARQVLKQVRPWMAPASPSRKINPVWAACFLTACASPGRWHCWQMQRCCCGREYCWSAPFAPAADKLAAVQLALELETETASSFLPRKTETHKSLNEISPHTLAFATPSYTSLNWRHRLFLALFFSFLYRDEQPMCWLTCFTSPPPGEGPRFGRSNFPVAHSSGPATALALGRYDCDSGLLQKIKL